MADVAYILCTLTSIICAVLLLRGYKKSGLRLLFWSGLCFIGLTLNNILVIVDVRLLPNVDLSTVRLFPTILGLILLIFGAIWEKG